MIVGRGCLGRPWLFRELAAVFDGQEPDEPPRLGAIVGVVRRHAELLCEFFGPAQGIVQMRKWCCWYTAGFPGSAAVRRALSSMTSLETMMAALDALDPEAAFPLVAPRMSRGKDGRRQKVALPPGYLADRDDDTPPVPPLSPEQLASFERALNAG